MDIVKIDDMTVLRTDKEFVFVFRENIHGPFPSTLAMYDAMLDLIKNPEDEETMKRFIKARKTPAIMRLSSKKGKN